MPTTVKTMCPMNCHPTYCGMEVDVEDDRVVAVRGDRDNPDSRGFLCIRGRSTIEVPDNPRRVLRPRVRDRREPDAWRETTWDEALQRVADAIESAGADRTVVSRGHGNSANGAGGQYALRFANLLGLHHWNPAIVCWGLGGFGLWLTGTTETHTVEDMRDHSDLIVLWGANIASQPLTAPALVQARRRGARVVAIDVRRTEAFAQADDRIVIRPGTDTALALAMLHVIIGERRHDADFVASHTVGFEELAEQVAGCTPSWAAEQTGIDADVIVDLARAYAGAQAAMVLIGGSSMHKTGNGWHAARAISCLPAVTGHLGRPGAGLGPRHAGQVHGMGLNQLSDGTEVPPERMISEMSSILAALEEDRVEVLLLLGTNLLSSFADAGRAAAALERMPMVVAFDLFENETIREYADVLLPGTSWVEETGFKATGNHLYLMEQAISARGDARPVRDVLDDLARRLGVTDMLPWETPEAALDTIFDHDATGHTTVAQLREAGGHVRLNTSPVAHPGLAFDTPSGRIELRSARAAELGLPQLPVYEPPQPDAYPLQLVQGRTIGHFHAFYDHGQALPTLARREPEPRLWINPVDAERRDVSDGAGVRLSNGRGAMEAVATVTDRTPPGVVWMRDGWAGLNTLTSGDRVVPDVAAERFPAGQASYEARVEVTPLDV
ncbi:molybdopterin-dependent oxidoreductase [Luteipulveratus sp. YIM 133132]|uniref:molybdopterin-containing oxidoreductase family protein n=1 Tax=Luteipulveratus flavus TaxID=3031728 RepID=UPI0023B047EF|nr:molybdopterin-dependent oxidoreductase [Luteipulveratus sp. YIM 133132]MDE9367455.1 molybdopterin-dependent oxidoreductase [Luteipulveratus sp. YIM 133132]